MTQVDEICLFVFLLLSINAFEENDLCRWWSWQVLKKSLGIYQEIL